MADATNFINANKEAVQNRVNQILQVLHLAHIGPTRTTLAAMQIIGAHFEDTFPDKPAGEGGKKTEEQLDVMAAQPSSLDELIQQLEKKKE